MNIKFEIYLLVVKFPGVFSAKSNSNRSELLIACGDRTGARPSPGVSGGDSDERDDDGTQPQDNHHGTGLIVGVPGEVLHAN